MNQFGKEKLLHPTAAGGSAEATTEQPLHPSAEWEVAQGAMFNIDGEWELTPEQRKEVTEFVNYYRATFPEDKRQHHTTVDIDAILTSWWLSKGRDYKKLFSGTR